jgi:glycosyltransferase involved in cell wall biosynthesis
VSEPFGLTPLEAIGYGTPVLISRQSGVSEVLLNCLKVDHWDIDEMANSILAVTQHSSLADELRRNAAEEYLHMTWQTAGQKIKNLYEEHVPDGVV